MMKAHRGAFGCDFDTVVIFFNDKGEGGEVDFLKSLLADRGTIIGEGASKLGEGETTPYTRVVVVEGITPQQGFDLAWDAWRKTPRGKSDKRKCGEYEGYQRTVALGVHPSRDLEKSVRSAILEDRRKKTDKKIHDYVMSQVADSVSLTA
jgi:hypothetical protein